VPSLRRAARRVPRRRPLADATTVQTPVVGEVGDRSGHTGEGCVLAQRLDDLVDGVVEAACGPTEASSLADHEATSSGGTAEAGTSTGAAEAAQRPGFGRNSSCSQAGRWPTTPRWCAGAALGRSARRGRGDDDRVAQVQEAHLGREAAEHAFDQQRVDVHAAEAGLLVAGRGRPAGLVVHDNQLAVGRRSSRSMMPRRRRSPISASSPISMPTGETSLGPPTRSSSDEDGGFRRPWPAARVVKAESHELGSSPIAVIASSRQPSATPRVRSRGRNGRRAARGRHGPRPFTAGTMVLSEAGR